MTSLIFLLMCLASVVRVSYQDSAQKPLVSEQCLDCLCQLISKCDVHRGCSNGDCGPFAITFPFWEDAVGVEDPDGTNSKDAKLQKEYKTCTTELLCSTKAIQNYMKRYQRDCNNDGVIDCLDFAAIHIQGPNGCLQSPFPDEKKTFMTTCLKKNQPGVYSAEMLLLNEEKKAHS